MRANTSYSLQSGNVIKSASIVSKLDVTPVTDGVSFQTNLSADEDSPIPFSSFLSKNDTSETIQEIIIAQNDVLLIKLPDEDNYTSLAQGPIVLSESQISNLDSILVKAGDNVSGINTQLQLTVQTQSISGDLSGEILSQSTIIPLTINPVADDLVIGTGSSSGTSINDVSSLFSLIDVNTGDKLTESILNDEDTSESSFLELKLDIELFSSLDRGETVSAVFTGNGIVAGSRILVGSGISTTIYEATQVSGTAYEIEIPSLDADFSISELFSKCLRKTQDTG